MCTSSPGSATMRLVVIDLGLRGLLGTVERCKQDSYAASGASSNKAPTEM